MNRLVPLQSALSPDSQARLKRLCTSVGKKNLAESRLALPVRYFSAGFGSVPSDDDGEGLKRELPLAQSAFSPLLSAAWLKIVVSIAPAAAMRSSLTLWV